MRREKDLKNIKTNNKFMCSFQMQKNSEKRNVAVNIIELTRKR